MHNAGSWRGVAITAALVDAPEAGAYRSWHERVASRAAALENSGFTAMAPRRAAKARSKPAPAVAHPVRVKAPSNKPTGGGDLRERLAAVECERDQLKVELESFKARHAAAGGNPGAGARPHFLGARIRCTTSWKERAEAGGPAF